MSPEIDHYAVLRVSREASPDEIRAAYRRAARASHPDLNPGDQTATERFKQVRIAYDVLDDPARRVAYDSETRTSPAPRAAPHRAPSDPRPVPTTTEEPVSLARELGLTVRAIRVMARRSGFGGRVRRLMHYLEGL